MHRHSLVIAAVFLVLAACTSSQLVNPTRGVEEPTEEHVAPQQPTLPDHLAHISYSGGAGSSCDSAIVIRDAKDTGEGIAAENVWIRWKFPGAQKAGQSLHHQNGRSYDVIELSTPDGSDLELCFDITAFFGKW